MTTRESIVAWTAAQRVAVVTTGEHVVAGSAAQHVVVAATNLHVVVVGALDDLLGIGWRSGFGVPLARLLGRLGGLRGGGLLGVSAEASVPAGIGTGGRPQADLVLKTFFGVSRTHSGFGCCSRPWGS
jgi:hypothetical protein